MFNDRPYVSLEPPDTRSFASEDPRGFLSGYPDGAVIDEVQRVPELASYLQSLVDDDPAPGRWIITGSQNLTLLDSVNQSLAGRTAILNLLPLTRNEIVRFGSATDNLEAAMLSGGYPRIFDRGLDPSTWLASYVATYVERDVRTVSKTVKWPFCTPKVPSYLRILGVSGRQTLLISDPMMGKMMGNRAAH